MLARGHVGITPLCYAVIGKPPIFASEAKAILVHPACVRKPDDGGIANSLGFNRSLWRSDRTFYRVVRPPCPPTCRRWIERDRPKERTDASIQSAIPGP